MIEHVGGNLLEADVEALVNTVNTVGIMGKGVALQFRQAYPENYVAYRKACKHGEIQPGRMFVFKTNKAINPRYIINFPTKRDWRSRAKIEDIEMGLRALVEVIQQRHIRSIALPPLGCGNGGLLWDDVRPRIEAAFAVLPNVRTLLYAPIGPPLAERMRVSTTRPNMTLTRAAVIALLEKYALPGYRVTMLEAQKLIYFLQVAGEPLRMTFTRADYGPYTEVLHHVLQAMEGHYIRGYGDRSRGASIRLLGKATEEAEAVLRDHPETKQRLERIGRLIECFETPYMMELLATIHWLVQEDPAIKDDLSATVQRVHAWSARKQATFHSDHIAIAWSHLHTQGWLKGFGEPVVPEHLNAL